jgi:hypothetical protein
LHGILGIDLAESRSAQLSASPCSVNEVDARRRQAVMRKLRQVLVATLIGMTISVGAFAQKNDNRPPKEQPKVVDKDKDKPPPGNNNQGNSNKPRKP